ncbi:MAG: helix-turn-helix transcriptional regulator [Thiotrichales bacterium]|nr:helix-turn-helix transcriptional regulator [Thiotrichales bacterium]
MNSFLTTREVAELLRVRERKVYELVAEQAIPVSRVTGKMLFPRDLVEAWVRRRVEFAAGTADLAPPPVVFAGSHDPLLDWAIRESGSEIATFFGGSIDGLTRLTNRKALAAGLHVFDPETGEFNLSLVANELAGQPVVMTEWAWRTQGLVVASGNPRGLASAADLAGVRFIPRQPEAGSHLLLRHLLAESGVGPDTVAMLDPPARTEADVALHVLEGRADAGLAVETVARMHRLDFIPLFRERYDLLVWRREYFEPPMQRLLAFCATAAFRRRAAELGGNDLSGLGTVHYNGG